MLIILEGQGDEQCFGRKEQKYASSIIHIENWQSYYEDKGAFFRCFARCEQQPRLRPPGHFSFVGGFREN
jgi:hypothetical protein